MREWVSGWRGPVHSMVQGRTAAGVRPCAPEEGWWRRVPAAAWRLRRAARGRRRHQPPLVTSGLPLLTSGRWLRCCKARACRCAPVRSPDLPGPCSYRCCRVSPASCRSTLGQVRPGRCVVPRCAATCSCLTRAPSAAATSARLGVRGTRRRRPALLLLLLPLAAAARAARSGGALAPACRHRRVGACSASTSTQSGAGRVRPIHAHGCFGQC